MDFATFDAQSAVGFVTNQRSHIEQGVNEIKYPDVQYPVLVPVDHSAHPFAKTVTYMTGDMAGKAEWINGNSHDIPMADFELGMFETPVYTAGIGYGYGWEEIGQAMMLGVNLDGSKARAARRGYLEMVDRVALRGDTVKGFSGLINYPTITPVAALTGGWSGSTTFQQIFADLNQGLLLSQKNSLWTSTADTLLLPMLKMQYLDGLVVPNTDKTFMSFFKEQNAYTQQTGRPLTIRGVRGLETAGAGSTQRMVTYKRDPEVLKLHVPMEHRFLPAQPRILRVDVPGVFRLGGLDIRQPTMFNYIDGI